VYAFAAVGQIRHNRPKVHQPTAERLFGTGPGFDPMQGNTSALSGFVYNVNCQARKAAAGSNLNGWGALKADAESASWDCWLVKRREPIQRRADQAGSKKNGTPSSPFTGSHACRSCPGPIWHTNVVIGGAALKAPRTGPNLSNYEAGRQGPSGGKTPLGFESIHQPRAGWRREMKHLLGYRLGDRGFGVNRAAQRAPGRRRPGVLA
jgi:hypothetical protein